MRLFSRCKPRGPTPLIPKHIDVRRGKHVFACLMQPVCDGHRWSPNSSESKLEGYGPNASLPTIPILQPGHTKHSLLFRDFGGSVLVATSPKPFEEPNANPFQTYPYQIGPIYLPSTESTAELVCPRSC